MANELLDILSENSGEISNEILLKYLNKELPPEEMHRVEKALLDNPMLNDALEGLEKVNQKENLPRIEMEITNRLQQYLNKRKAKKLNRKIKDLSWIYVTIVVILALLLIGYVLILFNDG